MYDTGEYGVGDFGIRFLFFFFFTHLSLLAYDTGEVGVGDFGVEFTPHESGSFIVLDVPQVSRLSQLNLLGETLNSKEIHINTFFFNNFKRIIKHQFVFSAPVMYIKC